MVSIKAKNVEVYLGNVDTASVDISGRGNNTTIAAEIDAEITGGNITNFTKISTNTTQVQVEPAEDDTETRNYFGSTSGGSQNSATETVVNSDVDITFNTDSQFNSTITKFGLADTGATHTTYSNYQSFELGSSATSSVIMLVRIYRLLNSVHYYKNIAIVDPTFKKVSVFSSSADDTVAEDEYTLLGNKASTFIDYYSHSSAESLTNF